MHDLPRLDDPDFWTGRGCVMLLGVFLSVLGIAAGVVFAIAGNTEGLLLVVIVLLAAILLQLSTKR